MTNKPPLKVGIAGYEPILGLDDAVRLTVEWYRVYLDDPSRAAVVCEVQIADYKGHLP